jgi:class 3 adenylate cyclase
VRRLEAIDKALLAILLPLWIVCFALHVREVSRTGFAQPPFFAAPPGPGETYPTVGGFRMERLPPDMSVQVGDRLIRLGDEDLSGRGYFGVDALALEQAGAALVTPLVYERDGERRVTQLSIPSQSLPWYRIPALVLIVAAASAVLLRSPEPRHGRLFFAAILPLAIVLTPFFGGPLLQTYASWAVFFLVGPVAVSMVLLWAIRFPPEVAERHRLSTGWAWFGVLFFVVRLNYVFGGPLPSNVVPITTVTLDSLYFAATIGILSWNYHKAEPIGRRRVRWFMYGAYVGVAPLALALLIPLVNPAFYEIALVASVLIAPALPVAVFVAMVAYNLLDIDRLISATATYSVLVVAAVAVMLAVLSTVADAASQLTGADLRFTQVALAVLLAAIAVPVNRKVRPRIERALFPERYALAQGIEALLRELGTFADLRTLARGAGERITGLLRPETCIVYARTNGEYAPVFVEGQSTPPAFQARATVIAVLEEHDGPLARTQRGGITEHEGDPFARAALEMLDASVLVPIRCGDQVRMFLDLGCKRSGDVYTPTDVALLAAVGEKMSNDLQRLETTARDEPERDALRHYVPSAVPDHVAEGEGLEPSERDVTVLFVDIRGYTGLSERRRPEEVFSLVNRYTEAVSKVVTAHGGSVVEFNGDGMMAVFGAPELLPDKERHAVEAALEIVRRTRGQAEPESQPGDAFEVGVGIASGPAFVGTICSADRWIWTAIGQTTNLAARLQDLCPRLDASILIDSPTRVAAGASAADFERNDEVPVRGLSRPMTLHAMPLARRDEVSLLIPSTSL